MKLDNLANILLAIFLILYGLLYFIDLPSGGVILAVLALAAGILKLVDR